MLTVSASILFGPHMRPLPWIGLGGTTRAQTLSFVMMGGEATSLLADATERDLWEDAQVLHSLHTHIHDSSLSARTRDRIYKRARSYRWMGSDLFKVMRRGVMVVAPRPTATEKIALDTHRDMAHFSV